MWLGAFQTWKKKKERKIDLHNQISLSWIVLVNKECYQSFMRDINYKYASTSGAGEHHVCFLQRCERIRGRVSDSSSPPGPEYFLFCFRPTSCTFHHMAKPWQTLLRPITDRGKDSCSCYWCPANQNPKYETQNPESVTQTPNTCSEAISVL